MGIKEEITKIAVEQGYEGAKPKSIAGAIDALADTLAGTDVEGKRTIAGTIHALAPYIGSGGGGGSLGPLVSSVIYDAGQAPVVGAEPNFLGAVQGIVKVMAGESTICAAGYDDETGYDGAILGEVKNVVAAKAVVQVASALEVVAAPFYSVAIDMNTNTYTRVTHLDIAYETSSVLVSGAEGPLFTFSMPELSDGEQLLMVLDAPGDDDDAPGDDES